MILFGKPNLLDGYYRVVVRLDFAVYCAEGNLAVIFDLILTVVVVSSQDHLPPIETPQ